MSEIEEIIARDIAQRDIEMSMGDIGGARSPHTVARDIIAALDKAAYVIVSKEPTEAMQQAVGAELERQHVALDEFSEPLSGAGIYRAMLHSLTEGKTG